MPITNLLRKKLLYVGGILFTIAKIIPWINSNQAGKRTFTMKALECWKKNSKEDTRRLKASHAYESAELMLRKQLWYQMIWATWVCARLKMPLCFHQIQEIALLNRIILVQYRCILYYQEPLRINHPARRVQPWGSGSSPNFSQALR